MTRRKKGLKELRVGLFILLALAIMIGGVFFIGGKGTLFGGKVHYKILFSSTSGLYEGDPVLLTGVEVGNVSSIGFPQSLEEQKILIEISVGKDISSRIRKNTRARVASASLVYGKVVELTMGSTDQPEIPPDEFIPSEEGIGYRGIVDSTSAMVNDIRRVLSKLDGGQGAAAMLLNEPLRMRETLDNLCVATRSLAGMMERLEKGEGALGSMLSDSVDLEPVLDDFRQAADNLETATRNLKGNESVLGRLINDAEYGKSVTADLQSAIRSLANVTAKIDSGQGTLGGLINDPELYRGLEDVVLGVRKSRVAKWLIRNRRSAGEKVREKTEAEEDLKR